MLPWYATREAVKRALDVQETARNNVQVDRAVAAASRSVDSDLRRLFYPEDATFTFRAPRGCGRVLFLDSEVDADLIALDTLTVDGTPVAAADRDLLPVQGPPFTRVELADTVGFGVTRRPVEIAGTWGYDGRTEPAGQLAAAITDTSTTTVDVTDGSAIGVGSLLTVDTERIVVSERAMLDTGQTLQNTLDASVADTTATVTDGTAYHVGEVLLVDAERLLIVDIAAGNDLVVKRQWDGTVLAAHTAVAVFALRHLTVERGALGTTAATHTLAAAVNRQVYPGPVVAYTVALALAELLGETSGYGREIAVAGAKTQVGGRGLGQVRDDARRGYKRMLLG